MLVEGAVRSPDIVRFLKHKQVEFAALCDVDSQHGEEAAKMIQADRGNRPKLFKDFRKLLETKQIDAVIIATPDHWHALPFAAACEAGKDIYQEKPLAHNIVEGRAMVNAAKRFKRVVQLGTWQRSTEHFANAIDFVRALGSPERRERLRGRGCTMGARLARTAASSWYSWGTRRIGPSDT